MHFRDGKLIVSPTDLTGYLACEHLTQLEAAAARGERERPDRADPELDLLTRHGESHERRYLDALKAQRLVIADIAADAGGRNDPEHAAGLTLQALRDGVDVVYQGVFFDGRWYSRPDFLIKVPKPSALGAHSYEVEDAKLARSAKGAAVLQICAYSAQLEPLQGAAPDHAHLQLGDMTRRSFLLREYMAYYRRVRQLFEDAVFGPPAAGYPEPVEHCSVCRWQGVCEGRWREDDHLSLVAGIRSDQRRKLEKKGVRTLTALAAMPPQQPVRRIGKPAWARLVQQASLQVEGRTASRPKHALLPPEGPDRGLSTLPEPTRDDLFFDMEGDPFVGDRGLEYLFGLTCLEHGKPVYKPFWAHNAAEEKRAFEAVIAFFMERLQRNPRLHIYHYAAYEPTALKKLMGLHVTCEDEMDSLLRGGVFVDLYRVVRQSVLASVESYSLKDLEPLYMAPRQGAIKDAAGSVVAYETWLERGDEAILREIEEYNKEDCLSTMGLRDWLEKLRNEAAAQFGEPPGRPETRSPEASPRVAGEVEETQRLVEALTKDMPPDPAGRTEDQEARWLLAQLLGWHRREAKAGWWSYFRQLEGSAEELVEDSEALGGLTSVGPVHEGTYTGFRYRFDPEQDHKIKEHDKPHNPATRRRAGYVEMVNNIEGMIDLSSVPRPAKKLRALIPGPPYDTTVVREALVRVAEWVVAHGMDAPGPYRNVRGLLLRRRPRVAGAPARADLSRPGETAVAVACRIVKQLKDTCLPIQGPPGTGKTYVAAHMIVELIKAGKTAGITATSHKVITNLLREVFRVADEKGVEIRALQKAPEYEWDTSLDMSFTNEYDPVETAVRRGAVDLVAGTSFLFSREALEESLDVLFVDEAGQMSLANTVAVGCAAKSLVLVGDPCQLPQPLQGTHPPGAERSALEHVLGGHKTIPPERGLFLGVTWRLHPEICRFTSEVFYEDRLVSEVSCAAQALGDGNPLGGVGLRFLPVPHEGNRVSAQEEAERIKAELKSLLERPWTDRRGDQRRLGLHDVLVVAPYNAQVSLLSRALPGVQVGTVDKFQGQQAPVVFYSMGTSSADTAPRGLGFLFSPNRINVATSRAQGLVVLVCSPELLRVRCRTPEQMRLANVLCRYVEMTSG